MNLLRFTVKRFKFIPILLILLQTKLRADPNSVSLFPIENRVYALADLAGLNISQTKLSKLIALCNQTILNEGSIRIWAFNASGENHYLMSLDKNKNILMYDLQKATQLKSNEKISDKNISFLSEIFDEPILFSENKNDASATVQFLFIIERFEKDKYTWAIRKYKNHNHKSYSGLIEIFTSAVKEPIGLGWTLDMINSHDSEDNAVELPPKK